MRFFIDECLSPTMAHALNHDGRHDAIHPRDRGRLRETDGRIAQACIGDDRIIVTGNGEDFRKLLQREAIHPGLIILASVSKAQGLSLMLAVIAYLETMPGRLEDAMVNHVVEVSASGLITRSPLPKA